MALPEGATLRQAVMASGLQDACPGVALDQLVTGIWGRKAGWDQPLRDADRVELYRPLTVDPKEARRQRYKRHKATAKAVAGTP